MQMCRLPSSRRIAWTIGANFPLARIEQKPDAKECIVPIRKRSTGQRLSKIELENFSRVVILTSRATGVSKLQNFHLWASPSLCER
jgi:hypothetical protein